MAYFEDCSEYTYELTGCHPNTQNIGWLECSHPFETWNPPEDFLDDLWSLCTIAVVQMRGLHVCDLCGSRYIIAERHGKQIWLGSAEIRVFSPSGEIYAAPNIIYHYVSVHQYRPPTVFIQALQTCPKPPSREYLDKLDVYKLQWNNVHLPPSK